MRANLILSLLLTANLSFAQEPRIFMFLNKRTDIEELPKDQLDQLMKGHLANIEKMAKEGHLLAAGPFEGGGGIFIFNSRSNEEVMGWLKGDPGIQANRWRLEMFPYFPRSGSVCPAKQPYEMILYSFVRFIPEIGKAEIENAPALMNQHENFIKRVAQSPSIITEATFGEMDGGILIWKGEFDKGEIEKDPAIKAGLLRADFKKLYIAKGSFCEK